MPFDTRLSSHSLKPVRGMGRKATVFGVLGILPFVVVGSAGQALAQDKNKKPIPPAYERKPTAIEIPSPLNLAQAIDLALILQPNIASAAAGVDRAEQQEVGQQSRYYPTLTPQYTYLYQYTFGTVNQFIPGSGVVVPIEQATTREVRQAQIALSYRIWDAGVREYNARAARQNLRAQLFSEQNTKQTVIANVADAYFTVLRNNALLEVSQAQVARAKNTFDVLKAQVDAGVAAQKDIFQAEADYQNALVNLLTAQNNAAVAQATLKSAIGFIGGEPLKLSPIAAPAPTTTATVKIEGMESGQLISEGADDVRNINLLTEAALKNRPDLQQAQQTVEAAKTQVKLSQINAGVRVNVDASGAEQYNPNNVFNNAGRNYQVNLSATYPLFDGGLVRSQVRSNRATQHQNEAQLESQRQQVAVEVEQAYRTLRQAKAAIPAAEAAQRAAQINYDAALESQKEGVGSIVEVITAQTSLVQAQTNYVQAVFNYYAADARLTRALGQADRIAEIGKQ